MASDDPQRELRWLRCLRDVSARLAEERDPEGVVTAILDGAIELCQAERGFLVRVEPEDTLRIVLARGFDQVGLSGIESAVSRTVVERVLERETRGLVTTDSEDAHLLEVSSVCNRHVRAIACVPLRVCARTLGVLYVDHRFDSAAFAANDLPLLRAFADQAALALETSELAGGAPPRAEQSSAYTAMAALRDGEGGTGLDELVGRSPAMRSLYEAILRAARGEAPVLIQSEPGCEDEQVARAIHARSSLARHPFLVANCAADEASLSSLLLGRRRGQGTGDRSERRGLLLLAGEGSVYLRRAAELPLPLQAALVGVLERGELTPLGGRRAHPIRCRLLVGVHEDLRARVAAGSFREDLYYRLDVLRVVVPPLRQRDGDLPLLFARAIEGLGAALKLSPAASLLLEDYRWPGNLIELGNEAQRLASLGQARISRNQISAEIRAAADTPAAPTLPEVERRMVESALRSARGNKAQAARQLGIPRTSLYHLIERYGLH